MFQFLSCGRQIIFSVQMVKCFLAMLKFKDNDWKQEDRGLWPAAERAAGKIRFLFHEVSRRLPWESNQNAEKKSLRGLNAPAKEASEFEKVRRIFC